MQLGWDKDDDKRKKLLRRRVTEDDIAEDDLRAYMGSGSEGEAEDKGSEGNSEGSDDDEAAQDKYRSLLLGGVEVRALPRMKGIEILPASLIVVLLLL